MSEKWKVHPDMLGSLVTIRDSKSMPIADGRNSSYAQQIAREHNAVPALVEALRECADLIEAKPASYRLLVRQRNALDKARAALALAQEKP